MGKNAWDGCDAWDHRPITLPEGLRTLADWFDAVYEDQGKNDEVQQDLRRWASDYRALEADRDKWKDQVENPKVTYCAFCGQEYDIDDREKALELIVKHVIECEQHPYAAIKRKLAALVSIAETLHDRLCDCKVDDHGFLVWPQIPHDDFLVLRAALDATKEE
jgi:hypothetical protein